MTKLLIIGRTGQLARGLVERAPNDVECVPVGREDFDLAHPEEIEGLLDRIAPDAIVNAAAYTAVDQAEEDTALAARVNADAPGTMAKAAQASGIPFVHVSTDYVFDGTGKHAYREADPTGPIGAYGRTKLAGEEAVYAASNDAIVVRTSWVYSPFGANFVATMLRLAQDRDEVSVVDDQFGCPTNALDLADGLHAAVRQRLATGSFVHDLYHLAGPRETSWFDFARDVFSASRSVGGPVARVSAIPSSQFPTPARRPANSRLDSSLFAGTFGYRMPDYRDTLADTVARLLAS